VVLVNGWEDGSKKEVVSTIELQLLNECHVIFICLKCIICDLPSASKNNNKKQSSAKNPSTLVRVS